MELLPTLMALAESVLPNKNVIDFATGGPSIAPSRKPQRWYCTVVCCIIKAIRGWRVLDVPGGHTGADGRNILFHDAVMQHPPPPTPSHYGTHFMPYLPVVWSTLWCRRRSDILAHDSMILAGLEVCSLWCSCTEPTHKRNPCRIIILAW